MYNIELSGQGSKQVYNLDGKPSNVNALRAALNLTGGELIFPGGKKLKGEDAVPFDADGLVKIRAFGQHMSMKAATPSVAATSLNKPPNEKNGTISQQNEVSRSEADDGNIQTANVGEPNVVIKGLSNMGEIRLHVPSSATYANVKQMLVSQEGCEVSEPSSIKFIGKGGKTPKDDELVPISVGGIVMLRAVRTERGHDELAKKVEVSDIIKRIEDAEKTIVQIRGRLFDPETSLLETRRIKHEMEDAISWLKNSKKAMEYIERAQAILNSL